MGYVLIISMHADPAMPPGYSEWGGTHTYMRELLDCLNEYGIECVLITRRAMEELPAIEQYHQHCKIYRLQNGDLAPMDKTKLREYHDDNLLSIEQIVDDLEEKPMVIHSVYWNSGRIGMELSQKYDIPLVHSVISNSLGRQARGAKEPVSDRAAYEKAIYNYSKWILCVSKDERDDLIRLYNISPEKIIVAGQYIHPSFIMPSRDNNGFPRLNSRISIDEQKSAANHYNNVFSNSTNDSFWSYKAFTYFGRIDENKGVDHILAAWHALYQKYDRECPPLWLIGGSINEINSMRQKCQDRLPHLRKAEKENKLVWWGCIDSVGASTLLLKTLVLVTNSLYEPGGRVITEAMSEGVPVIAAPNGFALDLVCNWKNGFLVPHGNETELSIRMEHFIRQPYLSNVLGENARQTAINVMKDWNFEHNHLLAYGMEMSHAADGTIPCVDYFSRREINIFPYRNIPLSNELLCNFLHESAGESAIYPPQKISTGGTSDIYQIQGKYNSYIIKHPYTRLSLSPIVLPIRNNEYVRSSLDFYNYEISAYEASDSNILIGKDDFHQLLLLRKLDTFVPHEKQYPDVLTFLCEQGQPLSRDMSEEYEQTILNAKLDTIEDIEALFTRLSENFPDYYFEPSAGFLPYLGWKIAPHLLAYNEWAINKKQKVFLESLLASFSRASELPLKYNWCEIYSDVGMNHIMLDNSNMCLIDREKRTIGIAEYVIADFLLDLCLQDNGGQASMCFNLLPGNIPHQCNKKLVIDSLAYKLFYEVVIRIVLGTDPVDSFLGILKTLQNIEETL